MHRTAIPLGLLLVLLLLAPALAGGGPETTLVVVNGDSPLSRAVANEYVSMRGIPASHVVELRGIPHLGVVDLAFFRQGILTPIREAMDERGITDSVDLIEYSADFPYGVNFRSALGGGNPGRAVGGIAALTGVTYLSRAVEAGRPFWSLGSNRYFRMVRPRALSPREQALAARARRALAGRDYAEAARSFRELFRTFREAADAWYNYACCLARLGRSDEALDALAVAGEKGFAMADHARADPDLASIRNDPRFEEIVASFTGAAVPFHPAHGFRSSYGWSSAAKPDRRDASEGRYVLSTALAYTGHDGNSLPEILRYLRAAASSDGTRPDGTVYLCRNEDVRSKAREPFFPSVVKALRSLDRRVEILEKGAAGQTGVLPVRKDDVIGAVVGKAGFAWGKCGSRLLPGAIAENLTSFGAHFGTPSQTKLTEFLRHGAAGSSGTVTEPLAIHMKFPNPMVHAFYAEGCSLAEAFYQSVGGPYQLLVVGDGLARPFAEFVEVDAGAPASPWSGTVELSPRAAGAGRFELFVDGRLVDTGKELALDTTALADGWHDVRVVAIGPEPVETRSVARIDAVVANGTEREDAVRRGAPVVAFEDSIEVRAVGASRLELRFAGRAVAVAEGASVAVAAAAVGPGPVSLTPVATYDDGTTWISPPVEVRVATPRPAKATGDTGPVKDGLLLEVRADGAEVERVIGNLGDGRGGETLRQAVTETGAERLVFTGFLEVPQSGFYRIHVRGSGTFALEIGERSLAAGADLGEGALWLPAGLEKGRHPIRIELAPGGRPDLTILLGGEIVTTTPTFSHDAE